MFRLLLLIALLAACSPSPKKYTSVEIGMPYMSDFFLLCPHSYVDRTTITEKGKTEIVVNKVDVATQYTAECTGTFTFVDNNLASIEH
jgi:hypothetical protein